MPAVGERSTRARLRGSRGTLSVLVVVATAACSGQASPPASVAPPATASAAPSAGPTAAGTSVAGSPVASDRPAGTAGPPFDSLVPWQAVRVAIPELNIREAPGTGAKRLEILKQGDILVLNGVGPVRANGFRWYEAIRAVQAPGSLPPLPTYPLDVPEAVVFGWVAAGDADGDYLEPVPLRCPTTIDLASVGGMLPSERLGCLGHATIELEGTFGCAGCGGASAGTYEPEWLASRLDFGFLSLEPETVFGPLTIHFPPEGPAAPPDGTIIRVRGHSDDDRAGTCRIAEVPGGAAGPEATLIPADEDSAVMWCRERFVVEAFDSLGTDPDFPET